MTRQYGNDRHLRFADLRIEPPAEWFRPGETLLAHVNGLQTGVAA